CWDIRLKRPERSLERGGQFGFLIRIAPIPVSALLVIAYYGTVLQPTAEGAALARQSLRAQEYLRRTMEPHLMESVPEDWERAIRRNRVGFVRQQILRPLQVA